MAKKQRQKPLSERELNRLDRFLESVGPSVMNIKMMDGFLAALICCPELLPVRVMPDVTGIFTFIKRHLKAENTSVPVAVLPDFRR